MRDSLGSYVKLCTTIFVIPLSLLWLLLPGSGQQPSTTATPGEVTATTSGWATLVGEPLRITHAEPSSLHRIGLMQVKFQVSDSETLTAFVNIASMPGGISPTSVPWKIGDEVLIVGVPGMQKSNRGPSKTYFVVDWRKKE